MFISRICLLVKRYSCLCWLKIGAFNRNLFQQLLLYGQWNFLSPCARQDCEFNSSPHIHPSTSQSRRRRYPIDSSGALGLHIPACQLSVSWRTRGRREDEKRKEWKRAEEGKTQKEHKEEKTLRILLLYFMRASQLLHVLSIYWDKKNLFLPLPMCLTLKRLSNGIWLCVWRRVLGVGLRTSQMLGKCSLTELQPWSFLLMK